MISICCFSCFLQLWERQFFVSISLSYHILFLEVNVHWTLKVLPADVRGRYKRKEESEWMLEKNEIDGSIGKNRTQSSPHCPLKSEPLIEASKKKMYKAWGEIVHNFDRFSASKIDWKLIVYVASRIKLWWVEHRTDRQLQHTHITYTETAAAAAVVTGEGRERRKELYARAIWLAGCWPVD